MDQAAFSLAMDNKVPMVVFGLDDPWKCDACSPR